MQENKIKQFISEMFGEVTVLQSQDDERIWFVVDEIYEKLGYSTAQKLYEKCDSEEVSNYLLTLNGERRNGARDIKKIITFDGLMDACGSARGERKEIWKSFRKWINNTVIPNIYKDGMYVNGEENCETHQDVLDLIDEATERKVMRKYGIGCRKDLTSTIKENISSNPHMFSTITDQLVYKPLFGKRARDLKAEFGVKSLRDDLFSTEELSNIAKQEDFVDRLLTSLKDYHKVKEIIVLN